MLFPPPTFVVSLVYLVNSSSFDKMQVGSSTSGEPSRHLTPPPQCWQHSLFIYRSSLHLCLEARIVCWDVCKYCWQVVQWLYWVSVLWSFAFIIGSSTCLFRKCPLALLGWPFRHLSPQALAQWLFIVTTIPLGSWWRSEATTEDPVADSPTWPFRFWRTHG